jgi:sulfur carrier protein
MKLTVNGELQDIDQAHTVRQLLEALNLAQQPVAVELNRQVVPRKLHDQTPLHEGDVLELVTLVGGG